MIESSLIERSIRAAWTRALGSSPTATADFLADGGSSIQLVTFLGDLEDEFECELDIIEFAEHPTVDRAMALIDSALHGQSIEAEDPVR